MVVHKKAQKKAQKADPWECQGQEMGTEDYNPDVDTMGHHEVVTKPEQWGFLVCQKTLIAQVSWGWQGFWKRHHTFLPWRINMLSRKTFFTWVFFLCLSWVLKIMLLILTKKYLFSSTCFHYHFYYKISVGITSSISPFRVLIIWRLFSSTICYIVSVPQKVFSSLQHFSQVKAP